jgi:hypothetical protein
MSPWLIVAMVILIFALFAATLAVAGLVVLLGRLFVRLDSLAERLQDSGGDLRALTESVDRNTKAAKAGVELVEGLELHGFTEGQLRIVGDQVKATKQLIEAVETLSEVVGDVTLRRRPHSPTMATEAEEVEAERRRAERKKTSVVPSADSMRLAGDV